jgi:hypothetical protein
MKTVTTAFKEAQKASAAVSVRRVSYKRRYWVQTSNSYTWESSWTVLPENEIVSVSPITGKLDTDKLNEFKISNVNLVLKNDRRQWKAGKRGGYFGATDIYPNGFEPNWTKFKIESGYDVNGTATYVPLFVGLATGFNTSAASDTVQVNVQGLEALLINANAENISTLVKYENMGTGNGSNKDFTTVHPGVGIIKEVSLNGTIKKPGTDYSISQTDDPTLGAKISFTTAPASGVVVMITYRYWKQNQKIEDVVGDLLTEAGISGGSRDISNVIFPTGVIQAHNISSQGDWAAGTKTLVDVNRTPGDLKINFADSGNKALLDNFNSSLDPAWSYAGNVSTIFSKVRLGPTNDSYIYRASSKVNGYWQVTFSLLGSYGAFCMYFMGQELVTGTFSHKYALRYGNGVLFEQFAGNPTALTLVKVSSAYNENSTIATSTISSVSTGVDHTIGVSRNADGAMMVYLDGSLILSGTDNSYSSSSNLMLTTNTGAYVYFDDLYSPSATAPGSWVSPPFDCLSAPSAWGQLSKSQTTTGTGSISYLTRSSTDGSTWDGYVAIGAGNQINSALKRYVQVKVDLTSGTTASDDISVQSISLPYTSATTLITMPTFADKTVYQAMQQIGSFANYEWGFNESEVFFFRPKQVDKTIDEILDGSINVIDVSSLSDGVDRVYSEVQATYGNFDITVGDDGITKDGPIARYGKRRLTIDGGDILLAPDTDIATGVALGFYAALKKPRQTMKVRTKYMEWLDLSDTVSLTFNDNIPARPWFFGDTSAYFGDKTLYFFGDADQTAKGMLCKVVGYRHDTESKTSEFDLEEII